jgi:N6-adenosine-specific RNA methylase IME4
MPNELAIRSEAHALAMLEQAKGLLATIKTADEAKGLLARATAIRLFWKQVGASLAIQNDAAEIRSRAGRRLGQLLNETVDHRGAAAKPGPGRGHKENQFHDGTGLPEGVSRQESHRWQLVASLPDEVFESHIARVKEEGAELTTASLIRAAHLHKHAGVETPPLPPDTYRCIVCDPPWPMEFVQRVVRPWQVDADYPRMTEEQIAELSIDTLAAPDCHLYLWFTHKHLPLALSLVERWGFRYELLMTWVKGATIEEANGFTPFGLWRRTTEHVLFARRGSLPLERAGLPIHFTAQRREHSRKPDEFYQLVRQASPGPRIDLFSRERRDGFASWGNEVDKFTQAAPDAAAGR